MTRSTRKIGLGVMGFADMLLHMGVPYNSEEGVALAEEIMDTVNSIGHQASEELAEIRGPFPSLTRASTGTAGPSETPPSPPSPPPAPCPSSPGYPPA